MSYFMIIIRDLYCCNNYPSFTQQHSSIASNHFVSTLLLNAHKSSFIDDYNTSIWWILRKQYSHDHNTDDYITPIE